MIGHVHGTCISFTDPLDIILHLDLIVLAIDEFVSMTLLFFFLVVGLCGVELCREDGVVVSVPVYVKKLSRAIMRRSQM